MKTSKVDDAMIAQGYWPTGLAAEKLRVNPVTLHRLVRDGKISYKRAAGKRYLPIQECLDYLGPIAAAQMGLTKPEVEPDPKS